MKLAVDLTPPRSNSSLSIMTPLEYLTTSSVQNRLKHKLSIEEVDMKRIKLDPMPVKEDISLGDYYTRVSTLLPEDRKNLHVHYRIDDTMEVSVFVIVMSNSSEII
jgi:hypothetical protein